MSCTIPSGHQQVTVDFRVQVRDYVCHPQEFEDVLQQPTHHGVMAGLGRRPALQLPGDLPVFQQRPQHRPHFRVLYPFHITGKIAVHLIRRHPGSG